jgi:hypothetical protein
MQISGKTFVVACSTRGVRVPWLDTFLEGATYPYLSSPYEAEAAEELRRRWEQRLAMLAGPFAPACSGVHLSECPTRACKHSMQSTLLQIIHSDWPDAEVRSAARRPHSGRQCAGCELVRCCVLHSALQCRAQMSRRCCAPFSCRALHAHCHVAIQHLHT